MPLFYFFFFNDTATTEIYTLSLHDALPICGAVCAGRRQRCVCAADGAWPQRVLRLRDDRGEQGRSEEHTSELQSPCNLVCRLLLEKKKKLQPHPAHRIVTNAYLPLHICLDS